LGSAVARRDLRDEKRGEKNADRAHHGCSDISLNAWRASLSGEPNGRLNGFRS
jgi:hypothetical protein